MSKTVHMYGAQHGVLLQGYTEGWLSQPMLHALSHICVSDGENIYNLLSPKFSFFFFKRESSCVAQAGVQ